MNKWSLVTPGRCCEANSGGIIQRILVVSWPATNLFEPARNGTSIQANGLYSRGAVRQLWLWGLNEMITLDSRWFVSCMCRTSRTNKMCSILSMRYISVCLDVYGRQLFLACKMQKAWNPNECTNNVQTEATNKCINTVIEGFEATCLWYTARMRFLCHSTFVRAWKNHSLWIFCEGCVVSRSACTKTIAKMEQC